MNDSLSSWIPSSYLKETSLVALKKSFQNNTPFPHLNLQNFFREEKIKKIGEALHQETFFPKNSDLFQFHQTNDFKGSRNKVIIGLRTFLCSPEFVDFMQKITGLTLRSTIIDLHATLYRDTDYLLCHDDQLEGRKIAFMIYLSMLTKKDGGSLQLLSSKNKKPDSVVKEIYPCYNSFVFFKVSPTSFHAVDEVIGNIPRLAMGGWLHGR